MAAADLQLVFQSDAAAAAAGRRRPIATRARDRVLVENEAPVRELLVRDCSEGYDVHIALTW